MVRKKLTSSEKDKIKNENGPCSDCGHYKTCGKSTSKKLCENFDLSPLGQEPRVMKYDDDPRKNNIVEEESE